MPSFLTAKDIVDIKNIIAVIIIVPIIFDTFARFRQNPPGVPGRFVLEEGIADPVG